MQYTSSRPLQEALRLRLRELAATHVRYGYQRLTVLLWREGWKVNAKRVYRLYDEENLKVRSVERKKISRRQRVAQSAASRPNECWSADFVSDKLADGRSYRILTVVDQFTRECIALVADRSLHGTHVVAALKRAIEERGAAPRSITLDNGAARRPGADANSSSADCDRYRRSSKRSVWLLRLCAVLLCAHGLLRAELLL